MEFKKSDITGVFEVHLDWQEFKDFEQSQKGSFDEYSGETGKSTGKTKTMPLSIIGRHMMIDGERYAIHAFKRNLAPTGEALLYVHKYIEEKPKPMKNPFPVYYQTEDMDEGYRILAPLCVMVYNDKWDDINSRLKNIKDEKAKLDEFISYKRSKQHIDSDNKIRFSNKEKQQFDKKIEDICGDFVSICETIPHALVYINYNNILSDKEKDRHRPKQIFQTLKKTNPSYVYPVPFKVEKIDDSLKFTPFDQEYLTEERIKDKNQLWNISGWRKHVDGPLGDNQDREGHTHMDLYEKIEKWINLIEPLVICHGFIIGEEGKEPIYGYMTGIFYKNDIPYKQGKISTILIPFEGKTFNEICINGITLDLKIRKKSGFWFV